MHVCMYACMHVHIYACIDVCMYACMHLCMYACINVCMYTYIYVYMYACMPNLPQKLKDGWVIPTSSSINIEFLFVGSFVSEPLLIVINPSH